MNRPAASPRRLVAQAGWIVAVLLLGWVGFIFLPFGGPKDPEAFPPAPPRPPSELNKVGLRDNVDWEQMPGIFAVWADRAYWQENKAYFSYRHPLSGKFFEYNFEVTKTTNGYRFREAEPPDYFGGSRTLGENCPFLFFVPGSDVGPMFSDPLALPKLSPPTTNPVRKVDVDLSNPPASPALPVTPPKG